MSEQKAARNKTFTDHKSLITELNCVHYCAIGGHLWYHTPPNEGKLPDCEHRTGSGDATIKFFAVCPRHKRTKRNRNYTKSFGFSDGDYDE